MVKKKEEEVKVEEEKVEEVVEADVISTVADDLKKAEAKIKKLEKTQRDSQPKQTTNDKPIILTAKARAMKKALDKQDKEMLFVPLGAKEKEGVQTITLNGYPYIIKKGVKVKVPAQVAEVYYDSVASQQKAVDDAKQRANKEEGR